jgi:pyruvate formate lyase activating enzyme
VSDGVTIQPTCDAIPTGTVFNIQRFSLHDGPGIRTTVFLKGCPLRCPWCHNPESQSGAPELAVLANRCIGCGGCVETCEHGAVTLQDGVAVTDWALCQRCGECTDVCPMAGRTLLGQEMTVTDLLREVARDCDFFEESGGGVTFSGGEPMAQPGFLIACLQACRGRGIHTTVDTCGYASQATLMDVAKWTDLFLYDVKIVDSALHERYTGVPSTPILDNLRWLCANGSRVWLRMPLIPDVNDDSASIEAVVSLIDSLAYRPSLQVLPYHAIGSDKYGRSGRIDPMNAAKPNADSRRREIVDYLVCHGVMASVGG